MKNNINKNYFQTKIFIDILAELGVKYSCISPGYRNTPLVFALTDNKKIINYTCIDERSSAFLALGIAQKAKSPVIIVTTSGTAVAELYPAIVEAYQQKIPLIICTADRPPELRNRGANQTINQENIFANHINYFKEIGIPSSKINAIRRIKKIAIEAYENSYNTNCGPVHINFPFEKPLEKNIFNGVTNYNLDLSNLKMPLKKTQKKANLISLAKEISNQQEGIITCGVGLENEFNEAVIKLSEALNYPIFADVATSLIFGNNKSKNIIENHTDLLESEKFNQKFSPKIILHFGAAPISKTMLNFFETSPAKKYLINKYGQWKDPSNTARQLIKYDEPTFCTDLMELIKLDKKKSRWINNFISFDKTVKEIKRTLKLYFPFEGSIYNTFVDLLPSKSNLMVSNSMPIRDFEDFVAKNNKEIKIFTNRGASGIDGIISTAMGIAKISNKKTFLIIGDLAFHHDSNGLLLSKLNKVDLTILLINNDGGGIFEMLPLASSNKALVKKFFTISHNIDFKGITEAYNGKHLLIKGEKDFTVLFKKTLKQKGLTVLEIKTDKKESKLIRNKYRKKIIEEIDRRL